MVRAKTLIAATAGLLAFSSTSYATDAWVSPTGSGSACTIGAPCATITAASAVVTAGGFVNVAPGSYTWAPFTTSKAGTSGNIVTYRCATSAGVYSRGQCIIKPTNGASSDAYMWENSGQYVTIKGFELDGRKTGGGTIRGGFSSSPTGTGPITYEENYIHHLYQVSMAVCNAGNGASALGIDSFNVAGATGHFLRNMVHDVGPQTASCNLAHGIYHSSTGTMINNVSFRASGWCITTWHDAQAIKIINNTVWGCLGGGISIGNGEAYQAVSPMSNSQISNNIVYQSGMGILANGNMGTGNVYSNNLVHSSGTAYTLTGTASSQTGGITSEPQFVNFIAAGGGDYHLIATSPGINQGVATNAPSTDYDGVTRPQSTAIDIGAYEFKTAVTPPPPDPTEPGLGLSFSTSGGTFTGDPNSGSYVLRVIGNVLGNSAQGAHVNFVNNAAGAVNAQKFMRITSGGTWEFRSNGYEKLLAMLDNGSTEFGPGASVRGGSNVYCASAYRFDSVGSSQRCVYQLLGTASSTSAVRLTADALSASATNCVNLPVNTTATYQIRVTARNQSTAGSDYSWVLPHGRISVDGTLGSTAVSNGTPTILARGTTTGAAVSVAADTTLGCLNVSFTPPTSNTSSWYVTATVETTETGM